MSHILGNRNSTPEGVGSSLRPPASRNISGGAHNLRASADMAGLNSPSSLANRGIRPASEVYYSQAASQSTNAEDAAEKAAQQWIADIDQYQITLEEMAAATLDLDFKEELSAIEQWFMVLAEPERTASLYALLQQTTQVQIRFFIQVLQQMAKNHPMAGVLSPANFGEKDPMSARMSDAMSKLNVEGSRESFGVGNKPPLATSNNRNSGLDANTINSMFPDAAAAIANQKAEFEQTTGNAPPPNRYSTVSDRSSQVAPKISAPDAALKKDTASQLSPSPWNARPNENTNPLARPKSSSGQAPMGHFSQGPMTGGLRSPRPLQLSGEGPVQSTTLTAPDHNLTGMPMLSPYNGSGNWASMVNTPMVSNFTAHQSAQQADMVANATAMKLAALSTVNNRIQLDDARKYRRARSTDGQSPALGMGSVPSTNILMTNELGQVLTPQQAAALQAQQLAAMAGRRSRPNSPGIALYGAPPSAGLQAPGLAPPSSNGFLTAYDGNMLNAGVPGLSHLNTTNLGGFGGGAEGYLSDHSEARGRSPRGRRGTSKPPEDPTDLALLSDIPAWLRTLRLHKYTDNLKDIKWQELVQLDDEGLEKRGVNALGARRKLLKVFEQVRDAQSSGAV